MCVCHLLELHLPCPLYMLPPAPGCTRSAAPGRYTTRTSALELDTFAAAKKRLIERGQHFAGAPLPGHAV